MSVELRHLRYFIAVAEEEGFTAAAGRVHVAQQVLSSQVRQLENILGFRLFDRTPRGVVLTVAGNALLHGARDTLASLNRTIAAARNAAIATTSLLTVGLNVSASSDMPTALLAHFERVCPAIRIRLRTFDLDQPAAGLLDRSADVAFVRPPVVASGLQVQILCTEPRVFALPASHPLATRDGLDLSDVAGHPWVAAEVAIDGCNPTAWRDDWIVKDRSVGDRPIVGAEARSLDEWREHVAAGRGISLCPASAERFYARPGLTFVPARGVPPAAIALAWRSDNVDEAVRQFVDVVTQQVDRVGTV